MRSGNALAFIRMIWTQYEFHLHAQYATPAARCGESSVSAFSLLASQPRGDSGHLDAESAGLSTCETARPVIVCL